MKSMPVAGMVFSISPPACHAGSRRGRELMHDDTPPPGAVTAEATTGPQAGTGFQPIMGTLRTTPLDVLAEILLGWKLRLMYGVLVGVLWSISLQANAYPPFDHAVARREWGLVMELIAAGALRLAALTFIVLIGSGWFWLCILYYCRRHVRRSTIYTLSANSISARDATGMHTTIPWADFKIIRPTGRLLVLRMSGRSRRLAIPWSGFAPQDVPRAQALARKVRMQHAAAPVAAAQPPAGVTALPAAMDEAGDNVTVSLRVTKGERFAIFLTLVPKLVVMTLGMVLILNLVAVLAAPTGRADLFGSTSLLDKARLLLAPDGHALVIDGGSVILSIVFMFMQRLRQRKKRPCERVRMDAQGMSLLDGDKVAIFFPWAIVTATATPRFLKIKWGKRMAFYYPWRLFSPQERARILAWAAQGGSTGYTSGQPAAG